MADQNQNEANGKAEECKELRSLTDLKAGTTMRPPNDQVLYGTLVGIGIAAEANNPNAKPELCLAICDPALKVHSIVMPLADAHKLLEGIPRTLEQADTFTRRN